MSSDEIVSFSSETYLSRPFLAGAWTFRVATPDIGSCNLIERIFADLQVPGAESENDGLFHLARVISTPTTERWSLTGPALKELQSVTLRSAVTMLITSVNLRALDFEPERLHLHASCVVRDGRGIVMSAPRDTGKTTTLAHLVLRGWQYLSDEAVSLGPDDLVLRGFAKPLSIKPGGRAHVAELSPHLAPPGDWSEPSDDVAHVALGEVGVGTTGVAAPGVVVILQRTHDRRLDAPIRQALHPTDAVVRLMGETMDAGRYGRRAVLELARLAAASRCIEVTVGPPDVTAELIENETMPAGSLEVRELPPSDSVAASVVSVTIGDRVVIHDVESGRILALDEPATEVWMQIGGWAHSDHIDLRGPVIAPFVAQLDALGLLAGQTVRRR